MDNIRNVISPGYKGGLCFVISGGQPDSQLIAIDPKKNYELSGQFKSDDPKIELLFGLIPFDKQKHQIRSMNINVMRNTETELTKPCKKGDFTLTVKDASKWQRGKLFYPAFEPEKGLPNFRLLKGVKRIAEVDGGYKVFLSKPCEFDYPAGTNTALNRATVGAIFTGALHTPIGTEWRECEGTISGEAKGISMKQFWPGTRYVKIFIAKRSHDPKSKLYFDDIKLKEIENKE